MILKYTDSSSLCEETDEVSGNIFIVGGVSVLWYRLEPSYLFLFFFYSFRLMFFSLSFVHTILVIYFSYSFFPLLYAPPFLNNIFYARLLFLLQQLLFYTRSPFIILTLFYYPIFPFALSLQSNFLSNNFSVLYSRSRFQYFNLIFFVIHGSFFLSLSSTSLNSLIF